MLPDKPKAQAGAGVGLGQQFKNQRKVPSLCDSCPDADQAGPMPRASIFLYAVSRESTQQKGVTISRNHRIRAGAARLGMFVVCVGLLFRVILINNLRIFIWLCPKVALALGPQLPAQKCQPFKCVPFAECARERKRERGNVPGCVCVCVLQGPFAFAWPIPRCAFSPLDAA